MKAYKSAAISGGKMVQLGSNSSSPPPENSAPTDIALSATSIAENNGIGSLIGILSTTDPNSGNTFTYTLVSGTGSTDNASFSIDGSNLRAGIAFDYETKSSYSIRIRSTDQGGLYFEKVFTISVTNVTEAPVITLPTQTAISDSSATVGATLDCKGLSTVWSIEYGATTDYGSTQAGGTTSENGAKTVNLTGLTQNNTIHWRFKAVNADGTAYSDDQTLTTVNTELVNYTSGLATALSDNESGNINSFISALKSGLGISTLSDYFDKIQLLNTETSEVSLRNVAKRAHDYQVMGSPVFSQFSGWKSGGTNNYLKTNYNPSTQAVRFTRDSAHINIFSNTSIAESAASYGGISTNGIMVAPNIGGTSYLLINQATNSLIPTVTDSSGLHSLIRESSTIVKYYRNGTLIQSFTVASTALVNLEMLALTRNSGTGATGFGVRELGLITVGKALTLSEINVIKDAYNTFVANRSLFFLTDESNENLLTESGEPIYA